MTALSLNFYFRTFLLKTHHISNCTKTHTELLLKVIVIISSRISDDQGRKAELHSVWLGSGSGENIQVSKIPFPMSGIQAKCITSLTLTVQNLKEAK